MLVLGIESSCDDTSVAVVSSERKVLSNVVSSQIELHREFGGVVPEIAAREHISNIELVYEEALRKTNISPDKIDAIAATCGPGLMGGLIVGSTFAKTLAVMLNKPFFPINHIEAHALSARLENPQLEFPYLLLLASGGHCIICVVHGAKHFQVLGRTLDDSLGEAFDKVAKMLGLKYPGGPEIEKHAKNGNMRYKLPLPLCNRNTCDMSFSGLKTAVRNVIQSERLDDVIINDVCCSFQQTVCNIVYKKCKFALQSVDVKSIVVAGGVAANMLIREKLMILADEHNISFFIPSLKICTDNAAMIAWNCVENLNAGFTEANISSPLMPRWMLSK